MDVSTNYSWSLWRESHNSTLESGLWSYKSYFFIVHHVALFVLSNNRSSCRQLFKKLGILPLQSQYILSLLSFVVQNKDQFTNNLKIHNINTRHNMNLHPPSLNLTLSQKGVHYSGIRLFNHLPVHNKQLAGDIKLFKPALRNLLWLHSYSIQEYLETNLIWTTSYLLLRTTYICTLITLLLITPMLLVKN